MCNPNSKFIYSHLRTEFEICSMSARKLDYARLMTIKNTLSSTCGLNITNITWGVTLGPPSGIKGMITSDYSMTKRATRRLQNTFLRSYKYQSPRNPFVAHLHRLAIIFHTIHPPFLGLLTLYRQYN